MPLEYLRTFNEHLSRITVDNTAKNAFIPIERTIVEYLLYSNSSLLEELAGRPSLAYQEFLWHNCLICRKLEKQLIAGLSTFRGKEDIHLNLSFDDTKTALRPWLLQQVVCKAFPALKSAKGQKILRFRFIDVHEDDVIMKWIEDSLSGDHSADDIKNDSRSNGNIIRTVESSIETSSAEPQIARVPSISLNVPRPTDRRSISRDPREGPDMPNPYLRPHTPNSMSASRDRRPSSANTEAQTTPPLVPRSAGQRDSTLQDFAHIETTVREHSRGRSPETERYNEQSAQSVRLIQSLLGPWTTEKDQRFDVLFLATREDSQRLAKSFDWGSYAPHVESSLGFLKIDFRPANINLIIRCSDAQSFVEVYTGHHSLHGLYHFMARAPMERLPIAIDTMSIIDLDDLKPEGTFYKDLSVRKRRSGPDLGHQLWQRSENALNLLNVALAKIRQRVDHIDGETSSLINSRSLKTEEDVPSQSLSGSLLVCELESCRGLCAEGVHQLERDTRGDWFFTTEDSGFSVRRFRCPSCACSLKHHATRPGAVNDVLTKQKQVDSAYNLQRMKLKQEAYNLGIQEAEIEHDIAKEEQEHEIWNKIMSVYTQYRESSKQFR